MMPALRPPFVGRFRSALLTILTWVHMLPGLLSPALAAEPIVLRSSLIPDAPWVGQRVILRFDVLAKDSWAQIRKFGPLEVPGAYVIQGSSQSTRLQETIDGSSYSGQRYEWSIYPQNSGALEIPSIPVEVTSKSFGADGSESTVSMTTQASSVTCQAPPGTEDLRGLISSSQLKATQSWDPPPKKTHKVGDAIKRSIRMEAADISSMAFTPMQHPPIVGVGLYPGEPTVKDTAGRGELSGTRVESVTYVFEQPGTVQLPAVVLPWWNITSETLEQIHLPGETLTITGAPPASSGAPAHDTAKQGPTTWRWIAIGLLSIAALGTFRFRHSLLTAWTTWRTARQSSEAAQFRRVLTSIRSNDPQATLRDLMHWIDAITPGPEPARLDHFLQSHADAQNLADQLSRAPDSPPDLASLAIGLTKARRHWIQQQRRQSRSRQVHAQLPPLNRIT
jgi:hypothetical protein